MKKTIKTIALVLIMFLSAGCTAEVGIVEQNGFMVLDVVQKSNHSTIVAKVIEMSDSQGDMVAMNIYDSDDIIFLEKEFSKGVGLGDVILITFNHDSVVKVTKNSMRVGERVKGQTVYNDTSE